MKQVRNKLYLRLAMLGLLVPLQVHAAGQDSVELNPNGTKVDVSLEMSNAPQEKITTVAVSLEVKADGQEKVTVDFQFSANLSGTEHGYVYNEDTGRLDIYVASASSLFSEEKLNLGSVQVVPVDSTKTVSANISYCQNSFQTANSSYGDKTPMVEGETASVDIKVGNGVDDSVSSGGNTTGTGNQNGGNTGGSANNTGGASQSGSNNQAGDNRNQGLYDETTRFVNDPASAQLLAASVIKRAKPDAALLDMSAMAPNGGGAGWRGTGSALAKPGSGISQTKETGKVTVVSPENGPTSILVAGEDSKTGTGSSQGGLFAGISGEDYTQDEEGGYAEILLDQEKGGAVDTRKDAKRNFIIAAGIALAVVLLVGGILLLVKTLRIPAAGGKRKRKKKKRKRKKHKKKKSKVK